MASWHRVSGSCMSDRTLSEELDGLTGQQPKMVAGINSICVGGDMGYELKAPRLRATSCRD